MTFLNPVVLFGLAAAAIPVILHLLNLRKLRTIDFSTLTFLKELQQSKIRRLKLRQIILLIVRTLMVIFIVLAFARPALQGNFPVALGGRAGSTVAFVLDDSYSMMLADENGERFTQAKEAARHVISLLKEGDAAFLVKLSELPRVTVAPATHDFRLLAEIIDRSEPSFVRRPVPDGVATAARLLGESRDANREMYIISDFQNSAFPGISLREGDTTATAASAGTPSAVDSSDRTAAAPGVRVFLVPLGARAAENYSVDSVEILSGIFEKEKPVELTAMIRNHGAAPLRDAVVSVYTGDTRVAQTNVSVDPGSSESLDLTFIPRGSGFIGGHVELEPDELEADNKRYFSFRIPDRIGVLVAGGSPRDVKFILPALRAGAPNDGKSVIAVTSITGSEFSRTNIRDFDVLMLCGLPAFGTTDAGRITDFVTEGGGLILFPGPGSDIANYNSTLLGPLSLPTIRGALPAGGDSAGLYFREIDFDHPLFASVFERGERAREARRLSPGIHRAIDFKPTPESRPVITLSNGNGFLTEQAVGKGRVLLFASATIPAWTDFPMKGLFAPLIHRSVVYLTMGRAPRPQFLTGEEAVVTVRNPGIRGTGAQGSGAQFGLRFPDGVEEFIMPAGSPSGLHFSYGSLPRPGVYELRGNNTVLAAFSVNTDHLEANVRTADDDEVDAYLTAIGIGPEQVSRLEPGDTMPARITEARLGVELWKYCVIIVLLLALIEMTINRRAHGEKTVEA